MATINYSQNYSMRQISRCALALTLAFTAVVVNAQDTINKGDLPDPRTSIDQNPVSVGEVPVTSQGQLPSRTRISNAGSSATDSSALGRVLTNGNTRDVLQQQTVVGGQADRQRVAPISEFQRFVQDGTGKLLPVFGAEFFDKTPSTFAPVLNSPVPSDYPLGPGDEVLVRGWGTIDIDFRATIDRNGLVTIPTIGSVVLGGVKAGDAETVVRGVVNRMYKGVTLNVSFGQLRAITVYVVGQASRPGTYTVSSTSSLVTALFASGGPNANGSMRHVQVKRAGKVMADLDLYAFIAKGDKSADIRLLDGDTIYIPPASGYVALVGRVNNPAIYELRGNDDTIASLLDTAGGAAVVADPRRAYLERLDPTKTQPRTVEEFALDAAGLKKTLKNGDLVNLTSITPEFANAVVLRGNVDQAIRAPFKPGMRISDLIPNRDYLISRASIRRQNDTLKAGQNDQESRADGENIAGRIGGLIDEVNWDYAVVERINHADLSVSLIPFHLGNVFSNPSGVDNVQLQPGDTVTVFSQSDVLVPVDKRRVFVRIEGEVNVPGVYQMTPGENLQTLLARAGGPTNNAYLFGTALYREQARREQEINLEKVASKLESQLRNEQSRTLANSSAITATDAQVAELRRQGAVDAARGAVVRIRQLKPTGRIAFGLDPHERSFNRLPPLKLENGDKLVVPTRPDFVHVFGAVNAESSPIWRAGKTVGDYLNGAGVTVDADQENIFVIRVDGSILSSDSNSWFRSGMRGVEVMPGDSIVVPERLDKETSWTKFVGGVKEWSQILANFGLGAAAIKVLR